MSGEIPYGDIDMLFLDAGGTLIHLDLHQIQARLAELGIACDRDALDRAVAASKPAVSRARASASTETEETVRLNVEAVLGILDERHGISDARASLGDVAAQLSAWLTRPEVSLSIWSRVPEEIPASLQALRSAGVRLVVVSNSDGRVDERLMDVELMQYLDGVVDSSRVGVEKPDPRIFHSALEQYSCDPARTVHVGDLYEIDVEGARAAGLHAVLLDPYGDWRDVDCETLADIPALAARILDARKG